MAKFLGEMFVEGGAEGEDAAESALPPELAGLEQDWAMVIRMLPAGWEAKARELGALRRLRGFDSVASLLRVLLIHLADGCSLRETAVRANAGGLTAVSDVALFKRLRGCGAWFEWLAREMTSEMGLRSTADVLLPGKRVRLIDGSVVCEPGATGSTWRLHYALDLQTLSCDEVHVTSAKVGESLKHFEIKPGDVLMADRAFATRQSLRYAVDRQADVVVRANLTNMPLHDDQGQRLALLPLLRTLKVGQAADWPAQAQDDLGTMAVRVCAYRKTSAQTLQTQKDIEREAKRQGQQVRPDTLEAAAYVIVVTTLREHSASAIMEFYRRRWQIELAFKRLKSLLGLGHLRKVDKDGARAWLQGKLLVACLIEKLILTAERFSPWGYDARDPAEAQSQTPQPLSLA